MLDYTRTKTIEDLVGVHGFRARDIIPAGSLVNLKCNNFKQPI
jgi:hypothetical protein